MTSRRARRCLLAIGCAVFAAGCSDSDRFVLVTVDASGTIPPADALVVTLATTFGDAGRTAMLRYPSSGPIKFPTTLGVRIPSSTKGSVVFTVEATDGGTLVARGADTLPVASGTLTVVLTKTGVMVSDGGGDGAGGDARPGDGGSDARDAAVEAKPSPLALLVVASAAAGSPAALGADDQALEALLTTDGYAVRLVGDRQTGMIADGGALDASVVVISDSTTPSLLALSLRTAAVPIVCLNPDEYPILYMSDSSPDDDYGTTTGDTIVVNGIGPFAASLSGSVKVLNASGNMGRGTPRGSAIVVATIPTNTNQATIFGYDKDVSLGGEIAPARRVGFFTTVGLVGKLTDDGKGLFAAALAWAAGSF